MTNANLSRVSIRYKTKNVHNHSLRSSLRELSFTPNTLLKYLEDSASDISFSPKPSAFTASFRNFFRTSLAPFSPQS